jgi:hypothetical protein
VALFQAVQLTQTTKKAEKTNPLMMKRHSAALLQFALCLFGASLIHGIVLVSFPVALAKTVFFFLSSFCSFQLNAKRFMRAGTIPTTQLIFMVFTTTQQ